MVVGCGHAGDGNVHLSVFQSDPERLEQVLRSVFAAGAALGGAVSGEPELNGGAGLYSSRN